MAQESAFAINIMLTSKIFGWPFHQFWLGYNENPLRLATSEFKPIAENSTELQCDIRPLS